MKSLLLSTLLLAAFSLHADTGQAFIALQHGRVGEAEKMLRAGLAAAPQPAAAQDTAAHQLLCRVFYAQDQADRAVPECEAAAAAAPNDTQNQLWLGRAYGLKAQHSSPLAAFALARKVHTAFERALQIAPANLAAGNDLGEFYVAAPAIVGGGLDKARALADSLQSRAPAAAHRIRAYIANKQKDPRTAEAEFQAEVTASPTPATLVDLGLFYQQQGRLDQAEAMLRRSIDSNTSRDSSLIDAAGILLAMNRAPELAERCMRAYLVSPAQTEDAPTFKVHLQLGQLLARRGDLSGAHREYESALALAPNYAPAQQAVRSAPKGA